MTDEVLEALSPRPDGRYVDGTLGEGGHAARILASESTVRLLAIDRDEHAIARASARLAGFAERVRYEHGAFGSIAEILERVGWGDGVDGILLDLGVSSLQLDVPGRGFSFRHAAPLDMRMDRSAGLTAAELLADASERELADIIFQYGEEHAARRIAREIVRVRTVRPIETTDHLRDLVMRAGVRGRPGHDPATRTFQALRIAVNSELEQLELVLDEGWRLLRPAGRFVVLTYHSLEDRMVKHTFRRWAAQCVCEPGRPICDCGWAAKVRFVVRGRRPPSAAEVAANPRARSAGLRAVERLPS